MHDDIIPQQPAAQNEDTRVGEADQESRNDATSTLPAEGYHTRSGTISRPSDRYGR